MHFIFKQTKHNLLVSLFFRTIYNGWHIKCPKKLFHFISCLINLFHFLGKAKNVGKILSCCSIRSFASVSVSVSIGACFLITVNTLLKKEKNRIKEKRLSKNGSFMIRVVERAWISVCQRSWGIMSKFKGHKKLKQLNTRWHYIFIYVKLRLSENNMGYETVFSCCVYFF